jgi:hypothetical protein
MVSFTIDALRGGLTVYHIFFFVFRNLLYLLSCSDCSCSSVVDTFFCILVDPLCKALF